MKEIEQTHLRDLLQDEARCEALIAEHNRIYLDFARQRMTPRTMELLLELAEETKVQEKVTSRAAPLYSPSS